MTAREQSALTLLSQQDRPFFRDYAERMVFARLVMCDSCGRHAVERKGQLCNVQDAENLWGCAEKSAYFAARIRGIQWAKGGTNVL